MQDETQQRIEGPTPNGGAYAIAQYTLEDGTPTTPDQAQKVEIIEYSETGEVLRRTYATLNG